MNAASFRTLALALPLVVEGSHMEHADFRVGATAKAKGKIFASLPARRAGDEFELGMVNLTLAQQREYLATSPGVFVPAAGAWGRRGYTFIVLAKASKSVVTRALVLAWENTAPKALVDECGGKTAKKAGSRR